MKVTDRDEWLEGILGNLSASDVKILIKSEEELAACQGFDRVFPTSETNKYFQFMEEVSFLILNYKRLCPLVPLFGNKCEICLSVTNV